MEEHSENTQWEVKLITYHYGQNSRDLGTSLGIWKGHIDDIAFHLAKHVVENESHLEFIKFNPKKPEEPTGFRVPISIEDDNLRILGQDRKYKVFSEYFRERPVTVLSSNYNGEVDVYLEHKDKKEIMLKNIMSKLSSEEKELLKKELGV